MREIADCEAYLVKVYDMYIRSISKRIYCDAHFTQSATTMLCNYECGRVTDMLNRGTCHDREAYVLICTSAWVRNDETDCAAHQTQSTILMVRTNQKNQYCCDGSLIFSVGGAVIMTRRCGLLRWGNVPFRFLTIEGHQLIVRLIWLRVYITWCH